MTVITAAQFKAMLQAGGTISNVQVNELIDIQPSDPIADGIDVHSSLLQDLRITGKTLPAIKFFITKIRTLHLIQCVVDSLSIGPQGSEFQRIEIDPQTTVNILNIASVDPSGGVRIAGAIVRKINVSDCSLQGFYMSMNAAVSCEWRTVNLNCSQVTFAGNFMFFQSQINT